MLKTIRDRLIWNDDFDREWALFHQRFLEFPQIHYSWSRRVKEKRAHWRERGRRQMLPANDAIFNALVEIANDLYGVSKDNERMSAIWPLLADRLYFASCEISHVPGKSIAFDRLPAQWQQFYEQRRNNDAERSTNGEA
jgi:hypothetical protein